MKSQKDFKCSVIWIILGFLVPISLQAQAINNEIAGQLSFSRDARVKKTIATIRQKIGKTASTARIIIGLNPTVTSSDPALKSAQSDGIMRNAIETSQSSILRKVPSLNLTTKSSHQKTRKYKHFPFMAIDVNANEFERLINLPEVVSIEDEQILAVNLAESTEFIGASAPTSKWGNWSQRNNGGGAWANGVNGSGQTIAILDTGVDKNHPFLANKVVSEACYSGGGITSQSLCPNSALSSIASNSALPCTTFNGCIHGTHVAGIAAGKGTSFSGVAPEANIIAIQVFSKVNGSISTNTGDFLAALDRVYALRDTFNIAAVNMSFSGDTIYQTNCDALFPATKSVLDKLRSVGIATVISSGNSYAKNGISFPGCISTAISVGATLDYPTQPNLENSLFNSSITDSSNTAGFLSLLAPGINITSSIPGGSYATLNGTSMAAAHVSGAWALLKQKAPYFLSVSAALDILKTSGEQTQDSNGAIITRINVSKATGSFNAFQAQSFDLINSILLED